MFRQFLCAVTRVNATRKIFRTLNCNLQLNNSVSNVVKNSIRKVHILSIYFSTFDTSLALQIGNEVIFERPAFHATCVHITTYLKWKTEKSSERMRRRRKKKLESLWSLHETHSRNFIVTPMRHVITNHVLCFLESIRVENYVPTPMQSYTVKA